MSEMVERVSLALANSNTPCRLLRFDELEAVARAAIEAMREPTPEVVKAFHDLWTEWDLERVRLAPGGQLTRPTWAEAYWSVGIEAALK